MPSESARHWTLDPEVVFLNHGSYGAVPRVVQELQQELQRELEREPVRFMRGRNRRIDRSRNAVAAFLGADPADVALVTNATHGVNAVLRSQAFRPGDQLLVTDHEYHACRNALDYVARRDGAEVVVAKIPFPLRDPEEVVAALVEKVTPRTVFCLVDQITSPTALVLPVARILEELQPRGIRVLVDGAHAPGQVAVRLGELQPDYWTGNFHKWPCAPLGSAALWVHPRHRDAIHPTVISHGYDAADGARSRFHQEFDWEGTFDPTAWSCIADTLEFVGSLHPDGWAGIRERNHQLALEARGLLCEGLGTEPVCPDSMVGTMASIALPAELRRRLRERDVDLFGELVDRFGIEVPVIGWAEPVGTMVRVSCHLYNAREDYETLLDALREVGSAADG